VKSVPTGQVTKYDSRSDVTLVWVCGRIFLAFTQGFF